MDFAAALRAEHSRAQTDRIAAAVGADARRFAELVGLMTGGDRLLAQRGAWAVAVVAEARPELTKPHLVKLLDHLAKPGLHPAVVRAIFRMLQTAPIPGNLEGRVLGVALAALGGVAPVAVKAYALTVLKRLAAGYPELMAEVRALIDEQLPDASPALLARARMEFGMGRGH
jgi:hypothetical protein